MARIFDAVQQYVGDTLRAANGKHRAAMAKWRESVKLATAKGEGQKLVKLLRDKPEQPELDDATAGIIGPFRSFLDDVSVAWRAARKHTMSVYGSGKAKGDVVWTGTLSSLVSRKPAKGALAKGRRIR